MVTQADTTRMFSRGIFWYVRLVSQRFPQCIGGGRGNVDSSARCFLASPGCYQQSQDFTMGRTLGIWTRTFLTLWATARQLTVITNQSFLCAHNTHTPAHTEILATKKSDTWCQEVDLRYERREARIIFPVCWINNKLPCWECGAQYWWSYESIKLKTINFDSSVMAFSRIKPLTLRNVCENLINLDISWDLKIGNTCVD